MIFFVKCLQSVAETLGMEGNVTERRLSVAITPLWLDSSATSTSTVTQQPAASTPGHNENREVTPRPETTSEDDFPPSKVQIKTSSDVPRIVIPPSRHHRGGQDTNFENTEVEELLAMLRETENLEDQGDILQYLVDTQGLDFNTGKYFMSLNMKLTVTNLMLF
jgi:phosphorylase kinase alpha/beta subunit